MGLLDRIFGKKSDGSTPNIEDSAKNIRETIEIMKKKEDYITKKIDDEINIAKFYAAKKDKRGGLAALKRKKRLEGNLKKLDGYITTLEMQLDSLENAEMNKEVFKVMAQSHQALKTTGVIDADEVHNLMDDIAEQQELSDEFSNLISSKVGFQTFDDNELMEEFTKLSETVTVPAAKEEVSLPQVPLEDPAVENDYELDDLLKWSAE